MRAQLVRSSIVGAWSASADAWDRLDQLDRPLIREPTFRVAGNAAASRSPGGQLVVLAGRLVRLEELRRALPREEGASACNSVATGFELLGEEVLRLLHGEWIVALWDPRRAVGILAHDALGGRSLHYAIAGRGLVFGEDARDVLALLARTPDPDPETAPAWLASGVTPETRSMFDGVHRLPAGQALRLDASGPRAFEFWSPQRGSLLSGSHDDLALELREEVDAAVERALEPDGPAGVLVSGGLDSTTVAASVAATRPSDLVLYSGTFPRYKEADEAAWIDELVERFAAPSVRSVIHGGRPVLASVPYVREWRLPYPSLTAFMWEPLMRRAHTDGCAVLLDGEGGDELFEIYPYHLLADLMRAGRLARAWQLTVKVPNADRGVRIRRRVKILRDFGAWPALPHRTHTALRGRREGHGPMLLRDKHRAAARRGYDPWGWQRGTGPLWWRHRVYSMTRGREILDVAGGLRRQAALVPIAGRHPFMFDRKLVEFALRLPPEASFDPRWNRPLARAALRGRVPESVRTRRGKSHFTQLGHDSLIGPERELLRRLLSNPRARVREYVEGAYLDDVLLSAEPARVHPGGGFGWASEIWRTAMMEMWLGQLEDPGFVDALAGDHRLATVDQRM